MSSFALAVDVGGTKVDAALVDEHGVLFRSSRFRAETGPGRTSQELATAVQSVVTDTLGALEPEANVLGIGIGSAGPIELDRGLVSPVNLPAWQDFALRHTVEGAAGRAGHDLQAVLRLDGLCITLAETWYGAARGCDSVLGMVVSTGVGGGIVVGGRVASGSSGNAGHVGQVEVPGFTEPGEDCTLEAIASGPRTIAWARAQGWRGNTGEELAADYASGNPTAYRAVHRSAAAVGRTIASVSTLLDLDCVVIGGGFVQVAADYIDLVQAAARHHAPFAYSAAVRILPAGLGADSPLVGAAALVHGPPAGLYSPRPQKKSARTAPTG